METLIQNEILDLILLSFEENTDEKKEAIKYVYQRYDALISMAPREVLINSIAFIDFIDNLYTTDEEAIKAILRVLKEEATKELDFKPDCNAIAAIGL